VNKQVWDRLANPGITDQEFLEFQKEFQEFLEFLEFHGVLEFYYNNYLRTRQQ